MLQQVTIVITQTEEGKKSRSEVGFDMTSAKPITFARDAVTDEVCIEPDNLAEYLAAVAFRAIQAGIAKYRGQMGAYRFDGEPAPEDN